MSALMLATNGGLIGIMVIVYLAIIVFEIAALWKVFVKAGQPGWAAIIPIYNLYILLKVIGRPAWWLLLFVAGVIVPFVGWILLIVIGIIIAIDLANEGQAAKATIERAAQLATEWREEVVMVLGLTLGGVPQQFERLPGRKKRRVAVELAGIDGVPGHGVQRIVLEDGDDTM